MKRQMKLVFEQMNQWRLRKIMPTEEGDRKEGLERVSAKTPQGNEPFGC